jgi:hypothetical protein
MGIRTYLKYWDRIVWDVIPCSLLERQQRFGGSCHFPEDRGSWFSETLVHIYQITQRHTLGDHNCNNPFRRVQISTYNIHLHYTSVSQASTIKSVGITLFMLPLKCWVLLTSDSTPRSDYPFYRSALYTVDYSDNQNCQPKRSGKKAKLSL